MKKTNLENLLDGSIVGVQDGTESLPVMKDGEEPEDMLLALLNNVLPSMILSQQAEIVGTGIVKEKPVTIIVIYGVKPTANSLLALIEVPTGLSQQPTANSQQIVGTYLGE